MHVLVVDDSMPRRRLLTALLGQAGHQVSTAPNGAAALELLAGQAVDAVVSDVKMPRMDGFQLCRALRRDPRWARLPFIFYSSIFIGGRAQELGMDLGATAYLDAKHVPPIRSPRRSTRSSTASPAPSTGRRSCSCATTWNSRAAITRSCSPR